jgi:hypothetical protein
MRLQWEKTLLGPSPYIVAEAWLNNTKPKLRHLGNTTAEFV